MDPLELRRRTDADSDSDSAEKPTASKNLMECYPAAASEPPWSRPHAFSPASTYTVKRGGSGWRR